MNPLLIAIPVLAAAALFAPRKSRVSSNGAGAAPPPVPPGVPPGSIPVTPIQPVAPTPPAPVTIMPVPSPWTSVSPGQPIQPVQPVQPVIPPVPPGVPEGSVPVEPITPVKPAPPQTIPVPSIPGDLLTTLPVDPRIREIVEEVIEVLPGLPGVIPLPTLPVEPVDPPLTGGPPDEHFQPSALAAEVYRHTRLGPAHMNNRERLNQLRAYQSEIGLTPDGLYGPATASSFIQWGWVPHKPWAWARQGTPLERQQRADWRALIDEQAASDPQRAEEWLRER